MKRVLKPDLLFCIFSIPLLCFLFSRMTTFFIDIKNFDISGIYATAGIVIAEIVIILFRKKITAYFFDGINISTTIILFLFSAACAYVLKPIFVRGCKDGGDFMCLLGSAFLFGLFLCQISKSIKYLFKRIKSLEFSKADILFIFGLFVVVNTQAFIYCKFMKEIFIWDNAGYFTSVHKFNDIFPGFEYFKSVYNSVFELDYNYVIMLPASIMCKLFGKSRLVFVLSIANFYLYPLYLIIYFCAKRYFKLGIGKIMCIIFCLPYLIFVTNSGFIDVGGIIPVIVAAILYYFCNRDRHSFVIGILLATAIYMRRWYSFFALSFIITVFIHSISKKNIKCFLEILCSFAFVLLFFTQDFVSSKLMADYKYMYSAYSLGIHTDWMIFTRYYGVLMTSTLFLCVLLNQIFNRKTIHNETFILFQTVLMFSLFVSVQTHGQQHLGLYIPAFAILLMWLMSKINKKSAIAIMAVLSIFQTANTFIPRVQPTSIQGIKRAAIIPNFSNYPDVEENAESILKITEYMDKHIGEKGETVCLLASSLKLNYETLKNAEISLSVKKKSDIDRDSYYYGISDVDKRDGLSENLFATDYILVPSELQIHLAENEQRVISVPYEEITSNTGVGTAYQKQDVTFTLTDGTEVYLYKKIRDISAEEIDTLRSRIFEPVT